MKVLILNGSPRKNGNTAALTNAFANGAKAALILTSGSPEVYGPAVSQYNMIFNDYMHLTDMGSILVHGEDNKSEATIKMAYKMGEAVR